MPRHRIAILTDARYLTPDTNDPYNCQILLEEAWLTQAFHQHDIDTVRVAWDDPDMDWRSVSAALFRSTWDYFDRFGEFEPWLERVAGQIKLFNRYDLLRWNLDKHYLRDLVEQGITIVPTRYIEQGHTLDLLATMQQLNWSEAVLKPAVSGSARLTYRISQASAAAHQSLLDNCVRQEAMMLQPFMPAILSHGEMSLMVINGRYTHAIRKTPKAGDFRVQDDHGGTVHPYFAADDEIAFAEKAVAACPVMPLYARADIIRDGDTLRVMELEMIEPELFFRFCPPAAQALADAIAGQL